MNKLSRLLPTPEQVRNNRWLRWMGPALHHPRLWHLSRRGLALGVALGIFFGLLVPLAQIPLSAAAAVVLRANLPAAIASTLVTNPATFGPIYFAAWKLGSSLLGEPMEPPAPEELKETAKALEPLPHDSGPSRATARLRAIGKPLVLGLAIMATVTAVSAYFLVSWLWTRRIRWRWKQRRLARLAKG